MAFPLPSFFKIRFKIIIVIAVVFVFLIGVVKQVLAQTPDDCWIFRRVHYEDYAWCSVTTQRLLNVDVTNHTSSLVTDDVQSSSGRCYTYRYQWYKWDNHPSNPQWVVQHVSSYFQNREGQPGSALIVNWDSDLMTDGQLPNGTAFCSDPCQQERDVLAQQCGEGNYIIDDDTCEGFCKCDDDDGDGICNACDLDPNDPEVTNVAWIWMRRYEPDGTLCDLSYVLKQSDCLALGNADVDVYDITAPGGCSDAARVDFTSTPDGSCYPFPIRDNCTPDNCNVCDYSPGGQPTLIAGGTTTQQDNTPQPDTDQQTDKCRAKCFPRPYMYVPSKDLCICTHDSDVTESPKEATQKPTTPPDYPETGSPNEAPGPEATDSDLLKALDENTRSATKNTETIAKSQAETNQLLEWIGENVQASATNTAQLGRQLADSNKQVGAGLNNVAGQLGALGDQLGGLGDEIGGLGDEIGEFGDTLGDKLDELKDAIEGDGEPGEDLNYDIPGEYSTGEHSFGDRTNQFLSDMSATGLFAVPGQFFGAIPSGGSPDFTIDGGETYGSHTLSFAGFANALLALRAVIQIAFMWLAIRIVTLKR